MLLHDFGTRYGLHRYIRKLVTLTYQQGGITANVMPQEILGAVDIWMFPKYPAQTVIVPPGPALAPALLSFVQLHWAALCECDTWLGTWVNPETNYWHIDITAGCWTLEEAQQQAFACGARDNRPIMAIYNIRQHRTVYLNHLTAIAGVAQGEHAAELGQRTKEQIS